MKKTAIISVALAIMLIIGAFSACSDTTGDAEGSKNSGTHGTQSNFNETGYPIVNDTITLKMMAMTDTDLIDDWNEIAFFKYMEELTNISFVFDTASTVDFQRKKSLAFATGDLPDVFFRCSPGFTEAEELTYGEQGKLIPLNDLVEKYGENIKAVFAERPDAKERTTNTDGNIYSLPCVYEKESFPIYYINTKWLSDLNLEMPTNTDDYYTVLKAFKERDPNGNGKADEVPMTGYVKESSKSQITDFMQNFGMMFSNSARYFYCDDGTVEYSPVQPEYKEALIYLRRLYREELLDNKWFVQTRAEMRNKGTNHQIGVMDCSEISTRIVPEYATEYGALEPFEANGKRVWATNNGYYGGVFAITSANEFPAETLRWVDYIYGADGSIFADFGKEGTDWQWIDEDTWQVMLEGEETEEQFKARVSVQPGFCSPFRLNSGFREQREMDAAAENQLKCFKTMAQYATEALPFFRLTSDAQDRANELQAPILKYVNAKMEAFITDKESIEDGWDAYVSELEGMGLAELTEIYANAVK